MSIGSTLAEARELPGCLVEEVADGDPDPSHPDPRPSSTTTSRPAAATSTPAATSAPSPRRSGSTRSRCSPSSTPAAPEAAPAARTEVFESETAARAERRGPELERRDGRRARAGRSSTASCRRSPATATGRADRRAPATSSSAPAQRAGQPVGRRPSGGGSERRGAGAARQGHRRGAAPRDRSWVQATTASGKELFQGLLQRGQVEDVHRQDSGIKLVVGNAGGVTLTVNGTDDRRAGRPRPGRPGAVHAPRTPPPAERGRSAVPPRRLGSAAMPPDRLDGPARRAGHPRLRAATRSTPRSSPAGSPPTAGSWSTTPPTPTSPSSTPAASSRRRRRTRSTPLLAAADLKDGGRTQAVVAVGCLAERYGEQLAEALPEADAVLGFDDYADISARLGGILDGDAHVPHVPRDRRTLLPLAPVDRPASARTSPVTGRSTRPARRRRARVRAAAAADAARRRPGRAAQARLRLRPALHVLRDPVLPRRVRLPAARRRARRGALAGRARACASSSWSARTPRRTARTSATCGCSRRCCPSWPPSTGIDRVRVSYLQPAEMRPGLIEVMAVDARRRALLRPVLPARQRPGAAPDAPVRRHRAVPRAARADPRGARPTAGVRSNVIVGFPGETEDDLAELERFLVAARLDAIGVFGYSDEDGTEAADAATASSTRTSSASASSASPRWPRSSSRSAPRSGSARPSRCWSRRSTPTPAREGRAAHQAPEVDGSRPDGARPAAARVVGPASWPRRSSTDAERRRPASAEAVA